MAAPVRTTFHELLIQTRLEAKQSIEGMSVLLGMSPEAYETLEAGKYPDDETLKRLCTMMDWNFFDTKRLIVNEMISPSNRAKLHNPAASASQPAGSGDTPHSQPRNSSTNLGAKLKEARLQVNQPVEIIAMLLNTSVDNYLGIEQGTQAPSAEVLRRISLAYGWNHNEMLDLLRGEQAQRLQSRLTLAPLIGQSAHLPKMRGLLDEIATLFARLNDKDQQHALAQMELVRDTMRRMQKAVS